MVVSSVAWWSLQSHGGLRLVAIVAAAVGTGLKMSHLSQVSKNLFIKLLSINVPDLMD